MVSRLKFGVDFKNHIESAHKSTQFDLCSFLSWKKDEKIGKCSYCRM